LLVPLLTDADDEASLDLSETTTESRVSIPERDDGLLTRRGFSRRRLVVELMVLAALMLVTGVHIDGEGGKRTIKRLLMFSHP